MKLKQVSLRDFGPFRSYTIPFDLPDHACLLLTGKNNEGKSHILFGLRLVDAALKVIGKKRFEFDVDGETTYRLLQQDVGDLTVGRLVYNYADRVARIIAAFRGGFEIRVFVDSVNDAIYATYKGKVPPDPERVFGFMPPLGQLATREERLTPGHLKASLDTTLAPRHFRNHVYQSLDHEEQDLTCRIVGESWSGVEFLGASWDWEAQQIDAFYSEGRIDREVSWAGQGLQVWFQIVAHMVRLRNHELLVLDEPEINLHAEKQHDLIRLLREYHTGSVLIATHSVELMNDVGVSHIIHVQKNTNAPALKATDDRAHLELVRSSVGSNFNLVASQFEAVDRILFTEERTDFKIVTGLAERLGVTVSVFGIPLHGFSEHPKAKYYREAYELLIGKQDTRFTALLDRDYYPPSYLADVTKSVEASGVKTVFTPGKEIENLFLAPEVLAHLLNPDQQQAWKAMWDAVCAKEYDEALGSGVTLYTAFLKPRPDPKTVMKQVKARLDADWGGPGRYLAVPGKAALGALRSFYRDQTGANLSENVLLAALVESKGGETKQLIREILQV